MPLPDPPVLTLRLIPLESVSARKSPQPRNSRIASKVFAAVTALSLTASAVLGASLFVPSWQADKEMTAITEQLTEQLTAAETEATPVEAFDPQQPPAATVHPAGEEYGLIHIPRLGAEWQRPIASGGNIDVIDRVMDANYAAHFAETQGLGEVGNFSLIGHREGVFGNFAAVEAGDLIHIKSEQGYFTYRVDLDPYLIVPEQVEVLNPVPMGAVDEEATARKLTLITCYPDWGNSHRRIVEATLTSWQPLSEGPPAGVNL